MTKSTEMISIIIPTYNRLVTLQQVLPSYINQNFVKEIIIIDDFSNDNTGLFLINLSKNEPKIKCYRNLKNMGAPYSKNRAISLATGKYVFIGEDDLELTLNYFEILLDHMKSCGADIIAGRRIWLKNNETKKEGLARADSIKAKPFNRNLLTTNCEVKLEKDSEVPLVDASMLIKKEVLNIVTYDEHYHKNSWREETDFQISALSLGFKIVFCPHNVNFHLYKKKNTGGNHAHSLFNHELEIFKNNLYMSRKHWKFLQKTFHLNYFFYLRFIYYRLSMLVVNKLVQIRRKIIRS